MNSNSVILYSRGSEDCSCVDERLTAIGISCTHVKQFEDVLHELGAAPHSLVIWRSSLLTDEIHEEFVKLTNLVPRTRILMAVSQGTVEDAVRCMKSGASDFMICEKLDSRLTESILRCLSHNPETHHQPGHSPTDELSESEPVLIGQSHAICEIRSAVNLVAKSQTTVLITGESGTGKEVISRLVHLKSNRAQKPFIALNSAALPKDVIENELFGHERGAFTGALLKKAGCFELADRGTLFFDEIAEMNVETQAKLLRVLETQKFRRLGGKEEVSVDVRVIAATNKNITAALHAKELREDLYYRVSVIEIFIPPLRERKEDIPLLVDYFLKLFAKKYRKPLQSFDDECLELLKNHDWPGNVREIRNVIERAHIISSKPIIGAQYLPDRIRKQSPRKVQINLPMGISTHEAERILILQTLASVGNNKSKTAKILGLSRKTLHNKLASYSTS